MQFERRIWTFREFPGLKVADSRVAGRRRVPLHMHRCDVLNVLLSGRQDMVEAVGGRAFQVEAGGVSVLPRGVVLSGEVAGHCLSIAVPAHWGLVRGGVLVARRLEVLASLFDKLGEQLVESQGVALLKASEYLRQSEPRLLSSPLCRTFPDESEAALISVFEEIESNFHQKLSLELLGDRVGWHPHYLQKLFRKRFGLTPARFQQQLRAEHALELLRLGHSGAEVAHLVGYCDQSHLIRSFRDFHGVSPRSVESADVRDVKILQSGETDVPLSSRHE